MARGKRSILVEILGDSKGYAAASKQAESATASFEDKVHQVGKAIAKAYIAKQIVGFGVAAVKAAVEDAAAQQTLATTLRNTTEATDAQIDSIEKWITKSSHQTGFLDDNLRPALSSLLRVTNDQTKAQDLLNLSMDVSRGTGADLETVSSAIAKAYGGNTTALAKLVPGIKHAGEGTLSFADAQDRLNKMFAGQAANYAETAAGKMAILTAQYQDMQEEIGTALMPILTQFVGILSTVFNWFNELDPATQNVAIALGVGAAAAYVAAAGLGAVNAALAAFSATVQISQPWLMGLSMAIGAVVAGILVFSNEEDAAASAQKRFTDQVMTASKRVDIQTVALLDAADAAKLYSKAIYADTENDARKKLLADDDMLASMKRLGISMDDVMQATHDLNKAEEIQAKLRAAAPKSLREKAELERKYGEGQAKLSTFIYENTQAARDSLETTLKAARYGDVAAISYLKQTDQLKLLTPEEQAHAQQLLEDAAAAEKASLATADLSTKFTILTSTSDRATVAAEKTRAKLADEAQAASDLKSAIDAIFAPYMNMEEAQRNLLNSTDALGQSLKDNGSTLDLNTAKGRANREAVENHVKSILDFTVAMVGAGSSTEDAAAYAEHYTDELKKQLKAAGLTDDQINEYIKTLGLTPENIQTTVTLAKADATKRQLEDMLSQLDDVDAGAIAEIKADIARGDFAIAQAKIDQLAKERNMTLRVGITGGGTIDLNTIGSKIYVKAHKRGGVTEGGTVLVGEEGPELANLPRGTRITPAGETSRILSAAGVGRRGGSGDVHYHAHVSAGVVVTDRELEAVIAGALSKASRREGRDVTTRSRVPI